MESPETIPQVDPSKGVFDYKGIILDVGNMTDVALCRSQIYYFMNRRSYLRGDETGEFELVCQILEALRQRRDLLKTKARLQQRLFPKRNENAE